MGRNGPLPHFQVLLRVEAHRFLELLRVRQEKVDREGAPGISAAVRSGQETHVCWYWLPLCLAWRGRGATLSFAWPGPSLSSESFFPLVCASALLRRGRRASSGLLPREPGCPNRHDGHPIAFAFFRRFLQGWLIKHFEPDHKPRERPAPNSSRRSVRPAVKRPDRDLHFLSGVLWRKRTRVLHVSSIDALTNFVKSF